MHTSRFQPFSPLRTPSLHRLKTAFSPSSTSNSPLSPSSTGTTSPLTRTSSPDSHYSSSSSLRALLLLRRKPSSLDIEMEEERRSFGAELAMLEPRPQVGVVAGGIFEVLDGRV